MTFWENIRFKCAVGLNVLGGLSTGTGIILISGAYLNMRTLSDEGVCEGAAIIIGFVLFINATVVAVTVKAQLPKRTYRFLVAPGIVSALLLLPAVLIRMFNYMK